MKFFAMSGFFLQKYIFTVSKEEPKGYTYTNFAPLRYGIPVWKKRNEHLIVRYPILLLIGGTVFLWILMDNAMDLENTNWFNKMLDYNYCGGFIVFIYTLKIKRRKICDISQELDQWWWYKFLEDNHERMKENLQIKLNKFYKHYSWFMLASAIGFSLMPFGRYLSDPQKSSRSLLIFQCWSPFPLTSWWGFLVVYFMEMITSVNMFYSWTFIATYLITVMETIGNQLELIGISLLTAEDRALRILGRCPKMNNDNRWNRIYIMILQKELKSSAKHYQKMYRLSKDACKLFAVPINICLYSGMFAVVLSCGKLATERNDKFVLLQAYLMFTSVLVNQLIISYTNQILIDQMESLRVTVYESPWHSMPISCRKVINIFQVMVMKYPSITTIIGSKIDMEYFGTVVQSSYYYLGALLSMNIKY